MFSFVKNLMFRDQVYNTVGRDRGQLSPNTDTFRRLNRRIHHNMGLLNTSRSSNHSSSFRMGRTELSAERYNSSRDREHPSQHLSGLPSHDCNESRAQIPNKMNSILNLSRRRLNHDGTRPMPMQRNGSKNNVQNLYMLTSNQPQQGRGRSNRAQQFEPQSPRALPHRQIAHDDRRRDHNSKQGVSQIRMGSHSRESKQGQRQRPKEQSRLRPNPHDSSRERRHAYDKQRQYDGQIQRLQQKYLENVYELNSPRTRKDDRRSRGKDMQEQVQLRAPQQQKPQPQSQQQPSSKNSINSYNSRGNYSSKNMNQYYFQEGQVSSTSGGTGIKTLPDPSKVDTNSEASLPVNSVASMKQISKGSISPKLHEKSTIKLDRRKHRNLKKQEKDKKREPDPQPSSLSMRWKLNNIQLQQRKDDFASKRKQKVINDGEQQPLPLGSVFLPIESKREQGREWAEDVLERIILHLECLNLIANYTKDFRKMYDSTEQWEVLIFLAYKKFYIERTKVATFLRNTPNKKEEQYLMNAQNPFILPYSKIEEDEITRFRGSRECIALRYEIEAEDTQIRNALRGLYNLYIEKSGEHVNMFDCDNFSEEIYKLMLEEVEGIAENLDESTLVEATKRRMGKIIQTGLLIAYLNGKYVKNFAQILLHEDTVKIGKRETLREDCAADLYLAEFKKVLS